MTFDADAEYERTVAEWVADGARPSLLKQHDVAALQRAHAAGVAQGREDTCRDVEFRIVKMLESPVSARVGADLIADDLRRIADAIAAERQPAPTCGPPSCNATGHGPWCGAGTPGDAPGRGTGT